jgi:hypothetical protein
MLAVRLWWIGRLTCPQCLNAFPKLVSASDWKLNNYNNPTQYAWQAGVQSLVSFIDQTGRSAAGGWAET